MGDRLFDRISELPPVDQNRVQHLLDQFLNVGNFDEIAVFDWFFFVHFIASLNENDEEDEVDNHLNRLRLAQGLEPDNFDVWFLDYVRDLRSSLRPGTRHLIRAANEDTAIYVEQVRQSRISVGTPGAFREVSYQRAVQERDPYGRIQWVLHHDHPRDVIAVQSTNLNLPAALPISYESADRPLREELLVGRRYLPEDILQNISSYLPAEEEQETPARYIQSAYGNVANYGPHLPAGHLVAEIEGGDANPTYAVNEHGVRYPPWRSRARGRAYRSTRRSRDIFFDRINRRR